MKWQSAQLVTLPPTWFLFTDRRQTNEERRHFTQQRGLSWQQVRDRATWASLETRSTASPGESAAPATQWWEYIKCFNHPIPFGRWEWAFKLYLKFVTSEWRVWNQTARFNLSFREALGHEKNLLSNQRTGNPILCGHMTKWPSYWTLNHPFSCSHQGMNGYWIFFDWRSDKI